MRFAIEIRFRPEADIRITVLALIKDNGIAAYVLRPFGGVLLDLSQHWNGVAPSKPGRKSKAAAPIPTL